MSKTKTLAVATLSLLLGAAPLCAQQAADAPERDSVETPKSQSQESQAANKPATAPATPPPATNNDSPFDYRSSEEISEDLSVSFPVDI